MDLFVPAALVATLWFVVAARLGSRWADGVEGLYLGLGIVAILSLLCYSAAGVNQPAALLLFAAVAVAGRTPSGILPTPTSWTTFSRLLAALIAITALLAFCLVSTPSVFIDNLHYHTGLPWQYAVEGRLVRQDFDLVGGYPQINEMLLLDVMVFVREPRIARLVNILLLLPFCAGLIQRRRSRGASALECGLLAWILTVATPLALQDATLGKNDILAMIFVYYAWTRLETFMNEGGTGNILLSGAYLGLSLGTKYTSLFFAPGFIACLAFFRARAAVPYRRAPALLAFAGACCLTFSPWPLRNLFVHGTPLYPFFLSRETLFAVSTDSGIVPLLEPSLGSLITNFPRLVVMGHGIKPITNVLGYHYLVGLIGLAGVAIARLRGILLFDALIFLPGIAAWSISNPQARYLLPVWLAMNVRISDATAMLEGVRRRTILGALSVMIAGNLAYEAYDEQRIFHRFDVVLGRVTASEYLHRFTPVPAIVASIPQSHRSDTILLVGETQRVYFENPLIVTGSEDPHPLAAILGDSVPPGTIAARLKGLGVRYVYVDYEWWGILRRGLGYLDLSAGDEAAFRQFLAEGCEMTARDQAGRSALYKLR